MKYSDPVRVGVGVLVWRDGKVLFGKRAGSHGANTWSVPGGHLEPGESWGACAQREVYEETGMTISEPRWLAVTNDLFDEGKHYVTLWMEANWIANEPRITEPDKYTDQRWIALNDLPEPLFASWKGLRAARPYLFR